MIDLRVPRVPLLPRVLLAALAGALAVYLAGLGFLFARAIFAMRGTGFFSAWDIAVWNTPALSALCHAVCCFSLLAQNRADSRWAAYSATAACVFLLPFGWVCVTNGTVANAQYWFVWAAPVLTAAIWLLWGRAALRSARER